MIRRLIVRWLERQERGVWAFTGRDLQPTYYGPVTNRRWRLLLTIRGALGYELRDPRDWKGDLL